MADTVVFVEFGGRVLLVESLEGLDGQRTVLPVVLLAPLELKGR